MILGKTADLTTLKEWQVDHAYVQLGVAKNPRKNPIGLGREPPAGIDPALVLHFRFPWVKMMSQFSKSMGYGG